jgi:methyl-accepting chemotaxis protein
LEDFNMTFWKRNDSESAALREALAQMERRYEALKSHSGIPHFEADIADPSSLGSSANKWQWPGDVAALVGLADNAPIGEFAARLKNGAALTQRLAAYLALPDKASFSASFHFNLPGGGLRKYRMTAGKAPSREGGVFLSGALIDLEGPVELDEDEIRMNEIERKGIIGMAQGLSALAQGDLSHRITVDFHPKAAVLKTDFNSAVEKLDGMMRGVVQTVSSLRSNTNEISSAANDLARRTEGSAAALEETAASLEQITATLGKTAQNTSKVSAVTSHAQSTAIKSGDIANNAIDAMSRIEESSRQIGDIIGVIDDIAFQTNLLALNAGVEAARAGEAGKGFAVVAQEVRELAQRSAKAAKEIKTLIAASSQHVGSGVSLVHDTGNALKEIVGEFSGIDSLIKEISAALGEQSTGLGQVNQTIRQMDQVTQQNAAMVEELSAASAALAGETSNLGQAAEAFKVSMSEPAGHERTAWRRAS